MRGCRRGAEDVEGVAVSGKKIIEGLKEAIKYAETGEGARVISLTPRKILEIRQKARSRVIQSGIFRVLHGDAKDGKMP